MKLHDEAALALTFSGEAVEFSHDVLMPHLVGLTVAITFSDGTMMEPFKIEGTEDFSLRGVLLDEHAERAIEKWTCPLWSDDEPYVESIHIY